MKLTKLMSVIIFLFFMNISYSQEEDPCITDPTNENCFEEFQIIPPQEKINDVLDEGLPLEENIENEGGGFFSNIIFKILIVLFILIIIGIIYFYFKNRSDNSEPASF